MASDATNANGSTSGGRIAACTARVVFSGGAIAEAVASPTFHLTAGTSVAIPLTLTFPNGNSDVYVNVSCAMSGVSITSIRVP